MLPRFALGNWWSRNVTYTDKGIYELIRNFERNKIPLSVMVFDHDWHYRNIGQYKDLKTGFSFNTSLEDCSIPIAIAGRESVTKLINNLMIDGKKGKAQTIVYDAFAMVAEKTGEEVP